MVAVVCGVAVLLLLPLAASEDDPLLIPEERVLVSSAVLLLPALSSRAASDSACSPAVGGQRPVDRDHRPESNVILARKLRLVKAFQGKCKSGKVVICVLTLRLHVYTQQDTYAEHLCQNLPGHAGHTLWLNSRMRTPMGVKSLGLQLSVSIYIWTIYIW